MSRQRTWLLAAGFVSVSLTATAACSRAEQVQTVPGVQAQAVQPTSCDQRSSRPDAGESDEVILKSGDQLVGNGGSPTYSSASRDDILAQYEIIAVLSVVDRAAPTLVASSRSVGAHTAASRVPDAANAPRAMKHVVRPVAFRVDRLIKGQTSGSCLALDVPGGRAGNVIERTQLFPASLTVGERVVAFLSSSVDQGSLVATSMLAVASDGSVTFPWGDKGTVNVDSWVLSGKAASAPAAPPADTASVARSSGAGTPGQRPPEGVRVSPDTTAAPIPLPEEKGGGVLRP